ncbi:PAPA-1-like conserved region-domain-containing protein, partial [Schizophyllum fasciatum]
SRQLTTRQAVLAHVADASHVALGASAEQASKTASPAKRRKKDLTESEAALRRAETARKRKDLSEKKLEDEKLETMNRLLKRKAGVGRGRRSAAAIAAAAAGTPVGESEVESAEREPEPATMYRWTSNASGITFSVPPAASVAVETGIRAPPQPSRACAVSGCAQPLKYRLVRDWTIGGCGMEHLRAL